MGEARYDSDRNNNGHFTKGNSASGGLNVHSQNFSNLRSLWYSATSVEDMTKVRDALLDLCLNCPSPEVKLKALIYFVDRLMGKPTERVELDCSPSASQSPIVELTPDEILVLEKMIARTEQPQQ